MPDAGWYDDSLVPGQMRYWDGNGWTDHVTPHPPTLANAPLAREPMASETRGKPWWQRWWAIAIGVFILLGLVGSLIGEDENPERTAAEATATTARRTTTTTERITTTQSVDPGTVPSAVESPSVTQRPTATTTRATTAPPPVPTTARPAPTTAVTTGETTAQAQARRKGADYLRVSAFSRQGLIEQLEFEGFSNADATYGADAQNANWKEQAAEKAGDYLEISGFSRQGMIEQLKFDGFTQSEAEYGASAVGL